jgi:ankyrin repeat protein
MCRSDLLLSVYDKILKPFLNLMVKSLLGDLEGVVECCLDMEIEDLRLVNNYVLKKACKNLDILKYLLQNFKFEISDVENLYCWTGFNSKIFITWAARKNLVNVLHFLFGKFSLSLDDLNTVILIAHENGHLTKKKMFNFLCSKGIKTFFQWACEFQFFELIERMIKNGFISNEDAIFALNISCEKENNLSLVKFLIDQLQLDKCVVNFVFNRACEIGNIDMIQFLLEKCSTDMEREDRFKNAILFACRHGDFRLLFHLQPSENVLTEIEETLEMEYLTTS